MSLDRIPGDANLYIGGLFCLRRKDRLKQANITHVVSALRLPLDDDLFTNFKHHIVEVDDVEDENIIEHFPGSNAFIQEGLDGGGGVLVHCAMGKSRSTTLIIAYLLSSTKPPSTTPLTPSTALALIRQSRPFAEPNSGFFHQLTLYHRMSCPATLSLLEAHPIYQHWLYQRSVEESLATGQAPRVGELRFGDEVGESKADGEDVEETGTGIRVGVGKLSLAAGEGEEGQGSTSSKKVEEEAPLPPPPASTYLCRRCRSPLANTSYLIPHTPKPPSHNPSSSPTTPCAHIHITPLSWMRPELELGKLEGRLFCPNKKCGQSVGRYAWQGMKCSCGEWVVPGMTLGRGRVDEVRARGKGRAEGKI